MCGSISSSSRGSEDPENQHQVWRGPNWQQLQDDGSCLKLLKTTLVELPTFLAPKSWPKCTKQTTWMAAKALKLYMSRLNPESEMIFLDAIVYKGDRLFKESILDVRTYFKPTKTFQYKSFYSCHPLCITKGFVKGELWPNYSQTTFGENIIDFATLLTIEVTQQQK